METCFTESWQTRTNNHQQKNAKAEKIIYGIQTCGSSDDCARRSNSSKHVIICCDGVTKPKAHNNAEYL